jgi:hypothetical protein
MLDRGLFWSPSTEEEASFAAQGVCVKLIRGLAQMLVSGRRVIGTGRLAALAPPVGFSGVASGPAYAVAIARDRSLVVSHKPLGLGEGWDLETASAFTIVDDAMLVLDITGPGLCELLSKATSLGPADPTPSAALLFAGLPCLAYRHTRPDVVRLHVERPLASALANWMRRV